ncbi:bifunctional 2-polyprenyl-6-hydroxyphenol methylase/3-demethylubiquinol 3-O-methyltransferase UbiG [Paenibacillus sp. NFR01]|uniref:class I SAM-dependent methyltransferase n=1 Tax=Paenibacillus sp. NFR01 TaxID=1566279 RepID=UPI0008B8AC7C|nr:class I SAM-dependent methyltransferase [Paenibacillus sp. NFR01]SET30401.1 Methyltransferase domain-containing protein [Paenibacillus sp. NFR01]
MFGQLSRYAVKPELYASSTAKFWDDAHISKGMLEAHLHPEWDAASRNFAFLDRSVQWIASIAPSLDSPDLLDLGCGPGLYAERFSAAGYTVMGLDFSKRSIEYAVAQSVLNGSGIKYSYQDYLDLDLPGRFDVVTLIYCDYGVLSPLERFRLLGRIHAALKPGGTFILDVHTTLNRKEEKETRQWEYHADGGFWSAEPHMCLNSFYRYIQQQTVLDQTIVVNDSSIQCYNIWEQYFTKESLYAEIQNVAEFRAAAFYDDIAGAPYTGDSCTLCAVFTK